MKSERSEVGGRRLEARGLDFLAQMQPVHRWHTWEKRTTRWRVYVLAEAGIVRYVGATKGLAQRIEQHRSRNQRKFDQVFYLKSDRRKAMLLEAFLITVLDPPWNRRVCPIGAEHIQAACDFFNEEWVSSVSGDIAVSDEKYQEWRKDRDRRRVKRDGPLELVHSDGTVEQVTGESWQAIFNRK